MVSDLRTSHANERCPVCGGKPCGQKTVERAERVAICGTCGSWYRVPRPTQQELAAIYDQGYYDAWGMDQDESIARETKLATFAGILKRLGRHVARGGEGRPRLLDVGAATGLLMAAAEADGWDPFGIDVNPYSAEILRGQFGAERVFEGELVHCPFPRGSFDAITMTDVIEHVLDVNGTLARTASLLRPGGVLCITTPRIDTTSRYLMGARWPHFKAEHIQYFSTNGIRQVLSAAGFSDTSICSHTKYLSVEYLFGQFRRYHHWLLTPSSAALRRLLPSGLAKRPIRYVCGEMLVVSWSTASDMQHRPGQ
ncbi:MAG: methyltransferase domain-containing protein [Phycisphaerae bacterium]|nr:methyltransferase domain-containing protein [Phycisphaerae bacterium]